MIALYLVGLTAAGLATPHTVSFAVDEHSGLLTLVDGVAWCESSPPDVCLGK